MHLCIFNPEHDLCLAKGRAHYVPPRSAVDFARRDAQAVMGVLYPEAECRSVYDITPPSPPQGGMKSTMLSASIPPRGGQGGVSSVVAWGWDAVVKHELLKRGIPESLLPSDEQISTIRELQHRSTVLPLQEDCHEVHSVEEMDVLLSEREHWVMKAPWSGAGRGLRWVHGSLTAIDRDWLLKTVAAQRCVIAEPRREVVADVALEYFFPHPCPSLREGTAAAVDKGIHPVPERGLGTRFLIPSLEGGVGVGDSFIGYSYFKTGSGVYKENILWSDEKIEQTFRLLPVRERVEHWLKENVWPRYRGPLGVDLMVCDDCSVHVAEINFRHTMGMVAHERINGCPHPFIPSLQGGNGEEK